MLRRRPVLVLAASTHRACCLCYRSLVLDRAVAVDYSTLCSCRWLTVALESCERSFWFLLVAALAGPLDSGTCCTRLRISLWQHRSLVDSRRSGANRRPSERRIDRIAMTGIRIWHWYITSLPPPHLLPAGPIAMAALVLAACPLSGFRRKISAAGFPLVGSIFCYCQSP